MGTFELLVGNNGQNGLVRLFGYQDTLSLDARGRFRIPDDLAGAIHHELGRVQQASGAEAPPVAFRRLSFYFAPGTRSRIFLYPTPNIRLAVDDFENPPNGHSPELIRRARDHFYAHLRFVEADKQNRLVIPEALRKHAGMDEEVQHIALIAQNYWLALARTELVEQWAAENQEAFEQVAPDLLDPIRRTPPAPSGGEPETD